MKIYAKGFSLIEVLVAMTIFAIGILGLMGMQARALDNFSDSKYRTDAALLVDSLINEVWVNRANLSTYVYAGSGGSTAVTAWLAEVQATLPKGTASIAVNVPTSTVTVTVFWQPPDEPAGSAPHHHTEITTIQNP